MTLARAGLGACRQPADPRQAPPEPVRIGPGSELGVLVADAGRNWACWLSLSDNDHAHVALRVEAACRQHARAFPGSICASHHAGAGAGPTPAPYRCAARSGP